jgi:glucarate dehydratase
VRITGASFHKINIPLEAPTLWIGGVNTSWTRTIVRMQTDEGIEGIAETSGGDATVGQLRTLLPLFVGSDPLDRTTLLRRLWYVPAADGMSGKNAVQALETACWDIMGKATGLPLHQLLGGKLRSQIPTIAYLFYRAMSAAHGRSDEDEAREMVEHGRELIERHGFGTIKLKGGVRTPDSEYGTALALREAFPHHRLRIDPNALWTVETAIRMGRRFEELDLEWYEDPVAGIEGMSRARRDVRIPFATNMCCVQLDQLPTAIRAGAMDVQLLDVHDWGGLTNAMKGAATCEAFQVGVGLHSSGEAGISTALNLHVAAALPSLPYAIDSLYHHQTRDVITVPHRYLNGCFTVPEGPGLGVEIDDDNLRQLESFNEEEGDRPSYAGVVSSEPRFPGMY